MNEEVIRALCQKIAGVHAGEHQWKEKAEIICKFAVNVSDEVRKRAGLHPNRADIWVANGLVEDMDDEGNFDNPPAGYVKDIYLHNVDPSLRLRIPEKLKAEHQIVFVADEVYDWDFKISEPIQTMSYEEAIGFIINWLDKKIALISSKRNIGTIDLLSIIRT